MELTNEVKVTIVKQKLEEWNQRFYSLNTDVKIAKLSEDDAMMKRVQVLLKTAVVALDVLKEELDALQPDNALDK